MLAPSIIGFRHKAETQPYGGILNKNDFGAFLAKP